MLTPDDLAEAEADAARAHALAGSDPARPLKMRTIATRITGFAPMRVRMRLAGALYELNGTLRIATQLGLSEERENHTLGHEIGHWLVRHDGRKMDLDFEDAYVDAVGAAIAVSRPAFHAAYRQKGARVHALAAMFHVEQAVALLRVGEVTGRPVVLVRPAPIVRGEPFEWGQNPLRIPRSVAHPIRVDGRWGMMAA